MSKFTITTNPMVLFSPCLCVCLCPFPLCISLSVSVSQSCCRIVGDFLPTAGGYGWDLIFRSGDKMAEASLTSGKIRTMHKMWETVQNSVEKHHPNKTVAVWVRNLFNDNTVSHFCKIFQSRQQQVSLKRFLVNVEWKKKKKIALSQWTAVILLVMGKVVLHNNSPLCLVAGTGQLYTF